MILRSLLGSSFDYYLDENTILDIFNSLNQKGITIGGFVGNDLSFDYINNFKFGENIANLFGSYKKKLGRN